MRLDKMLAAGTDRNHGTSFAGILATAVAATVLLAPLAAHAAGGSGPVGPSTAVKFEEIPGSKVKRVILTPKAAERIGIETSKVDVQPVIRKQMVGGKFVRQLEYMPSREASKGAFGGFGRVKATLTPQPVPAAASPPVKGDGWVRLTLSHGEWDKLAKEEPVRVFPLNTHESAVKELTAIPSKILPIEDRKRSMLTVYYVVVDSDHGLELNQRVRVELVLAGSGDEAKVVPYGAVYYDSDGSAWTYVNPEPLVFERQRINVERVVGDLAVLSEGPSVGTSVVTIGAALLFGAEVIFKR